MLQTEALEILKMGKNVFLTGPAGSGKTHVLNSYIQYLKSNAVDVAVTASTGIAATHLGGQTIHAWSGLGIRDNLTDYEIDEMLQKQYLFKRFERTKVLIIDEVSMLHSYRLDYIEWICRRMKYSDKPFGGMQVILSGDFFQLPPVTRGFGTQESEFAYKSDSWERAGFNVCYLSEQHRQKDNSYLEILNQIRSNSITEKTIDLLKSRLGKDPDSGAESTRLYTHNIDVDVVNNKYLDLIDNEEKIFEMSWKGSRHLAETLKKSCLSPDILKLKKGAKVMFTKNQMEGGYVNGTLGIVEDFNSFGDPVIRTNGGMTFSVTPQAWKIEEEGKVKAEISQLPLRLAWAITVHKSQGMSLDAMEVDLSKSFVKGMGYVALSRVRSLGGMKLIGFNDMSLLVDGDVLRHDMKFRKMSDSAEAVLSDMSRGEIRDKQEEYLKSIEPEEKVKIKLKEKAMKKSTHEITAEMITKEISLTEIADARKVKPETIVSHIEDMLNKKNCPDFSYMRQEFKKGELHDILSAMEKVGSKTLSPVYNLLAKQKKRQTYLKIRLARLFTEK